MTTEVRKQVRSTLEPGSLVSLYGTAEPPQAVQAIQIGPLSFRYAHDSLRRIAWHGKELVRAIAWPIRDENWSTYAPEIIEETVEGDAESFTGRIKFAVSEGRLICELRLSALSRGDIRADLTLSPVGKPFATNRAGFTVLHPIRGLAGAPLHVRHSDGATEDTEFPQLISPDQPVMDIRGLRYGIGEATVDIAFEGEVFEMEDQRNWSDASYKTYCVPLVHPFTYVIDQPVTQSVRMSCGGGGAKDRAATTGALSATVSERTAPRIGLSLEADWTGGPQSRDLITKSGASHLLLRVPPAEGRDYLADSAELAKRLGAEVDAEIVLRAEDTVEDGLEAAARALAENGLTPARVLALTEGYLASHQPGGPWPDGPTPSEICQTARRVFPGAAIGGGMMSNFTEMNRCRPDPALCDFVAHGNTAIVHASDDMSVIETLETLPQIFESAQALSGGRPYRLGLVSIGMRSNPYGEAVAENPGQVRRTMAREDPRQRGLFAAAWAVGVLAATEGHGVEALCLAAPVGPFGIIYERQRYPQAGYDDGQGRIYPLFHIAREACGMAGSARLSFDGLPGALAAYGVRHGDTHRMMVANVSPEPQSVGLGQAASISVLDACTYHTAISEPDWLEKADRQWLSRLDLGPFAVGFATWSV